MKIKCRPEDFLVEELRTIDPVDQGPFTLYRLTKTGLGTPEALDAIRRRWNLAPEQVSHGGLKDRHARTIQYISIARGPVREMVQESFLLEPLGHLGRPYGPAQFRGNRFTLVLRDLSAHETGQLLESIKSLAQDGIPNYFDDQRFGSVTSDGDFPAEAWLRGDHEKALWSAMAAPNPHDRPADRRIKETLRALWGQWAEAKQALPKSHARSLVTFLVDHPTDFRAAFARIKRDLRRLYFSAFESHLWNLTLAGLIERWTDPEHRIDYPFRTGTLPLPIGLDTHASEKLHRLKIPLPSARNPKPTGELGAVVDRVLSGRNLDWTDLRVKHLKDVYLGKGDRAATYRIEGLEFHSEPDVLYPGKQAITLRFELPRGAYATMIVKRLESVALRSASPDGRGQA